ncbi:MAG: PAS domain-containing protein, partial [Desulfobulbaceae bacterium]|nr:PAS domain-containing protein [Desulfobulbaceae bacterium]
MLNVRSIRSKVSICVYVALAGYLVATLSSIFSNAGISNELNHLRIHHLPLSILTEKLHSLLKEQNALYEEAFLLEEPDQAIKGNDISEEIFSLLEEITANTKRHSMEDCTQIADLSYRYSNFARAAYIYLRAARGEEVNQEKIKNLGVMKGQLLWEFEKLARHYTVLVEYDIESSSNLAKRNTAFLISTLIIVLILVIFLANWVANRLLIKPLSKTQDMVKKFSQGGRILEPAKADRGDEIGELTYSFWQLTEDLQKTTVSKNYVDNIIRSMSDSLIVTTSDGTIKTVNQATLKMLDYQEEELLNHPVTIVHGDDIHLQESPVEEAYSLEKTYKKKNGQRIPVNFSAAVMKDEEQNV